MAYLRRMKYGRSSEQLEHAQLELVGGQVRRPWRPRAPLPTRATSHRWMNTARSGRTSRGRTCVTCRSTCRGAPSCTPAGHQAGCDCPACGLALREIGQDVTEVLDYEPGSFHVVRHVRPKLACSGCKDILQAAAPSRPIERGMAGAGLLAHVLVSKYADHTPLYRQTPDLRARRRGAAALDADRLGRPGGAAADAAGRGHRPLRACRPTRSTATTRRSGCSAARAARRTRAGCGSTFATTDPAAARPARRCGSSTRRTARASIRPST